MLDIAGRRPEPFTFQQLKSEFQGFRLSYWGVFGGFNVIAPQPLYWFYDLLVLAGLAGWTAWLVRRRGKWRSPAAERLLVLAVWVLLVLVALIRWTSADLCLAGPAGVPRDRRHRRPGRLRPGGLAAPALAGARTGCRQRRALPAGRGDPVCGHPPGVRPAADFDRRRCACRRAAQRCDARRRRCVCWATSCRRESVRPGETVPVTVYWQLTEPTDRDLAVFVHLLGRGGEPVGQVNSYPGLGAYPLKPVAGRVMWCATRTRCR